MTYEESQKLKQQHEAAEQKCREPVRQLEQDRYELQQKEMRDYYFVAMNNGDPNHRFRISVNPIFELVRADFLHHTPEYISYKAYLILSEVVEMFEGWRGGTVKHLPPSGDWDAAKAWLARQQIGGTK